MHAVGQKSDRTLLLGNVRPDVAPHSARHLGVEPADRVHCAGRPERERRHVELRAGAAVVRPEREETIAVGSERPPGAGEMFFDQMERKRVVTRGDGRMRGEDGGPADLVERLVEGRSLFGEVANALQHDERGVPFVQMEHGRIGAERLERAHAADAENDFLLDPRFAVAAVQARRELTIPRRILFEVGVEQVQRDAADAHAPHGDEHGAVAERHRRDAGLPVGRHRRLDRRVGPVQMLVAFFLPPFGRDVLMEVTLRVHEPHADERHAEVARFLAVIAGQNAEPAGVDRQRLVDRELRGKVRDRLAVKVRERARPPGVVGRPRRLECGDCKIVDSQKFRIRGRGLYFFMRNHLQHAHGVVRRCAPERVIEAPKYLARVVPAPPQVDREVMEPGNARGKGGEVGVFVH